MTLHRNESWRGGFDNGGKPAVKQGGGVTREVMLEQSKGEVGGRSAAASGHGDLMLPTLEDLGEGEHPELKEKGGDVDVGENVSAEEISKICCIQGTFGVITILMVSEGMRQTKRWVRIQEL